MEICGSYMFESSVSKDMKRKDVTREGGSKKGTVTLTRNC